MSINLVKLPQDFLQRTPQNLHEVMEDMTIVQIPGKKSPPLILSCLIHGNETTGLLVMQELVKKYGESHWPRETYLIFGNLTAAAQGRRHLDGQPDFNRVWQDGDSPENKRAVQILEFFKSKAPFACIDIHNNTGRNPHYSCVSSTKAQTVSLAKMFSESSLYFEDYIPAQTCGMSVICPAITLEAGLPGKADGTKHVVEFVEHVMTLDAIPNQSLTSDDYDLMHIAATIKVPAEFSVGLKGQDQADVLFDSDLDLLNFKEIEPGAVVAEITSPQAKLQVLSPDDQDLQTEYLEIKNNQIVVKKTFVPAMITLDKKIIKSDCLGYILSKMQY